MRASSDGRQRRSPAIVALVVAPVALALLVATFTRASAYEEIAVLGGGVLTGTVRFAARPPVLPPIRVTKNRDVCGDEVRPEVIVVGPDRGVKGAVVLLDGVARGKKIASRVVLDTAKCRFAPHVAATTVGASARVKNSDHVLHAARGVMGAVNVFNVALPGKEQVIDISKHLATPGVIRVTCLVHGHESGWLVIHDSPYVATTDERGVYRIGGIPPGTYRVRMWHEGFHLKGIDTDGRPVYDRARTVSRTVTIARTATVTADFTLR